MTLYILRAIAVFVVIFLINRNVQWHKLTPKHFLIMLGASALATASALLCVDIVYGWFA